MNALDIFRISSAVDSPITAQETTLRWRQRIAEFLIDQAEAFAADEDDEVSSTQPPKEVSEATKYYVHASWDASEQSYSEQDLEVKALVLTCLRGCLSAHTVRELL